MRTGRPKRYLDIIRKLDNDTIYSPGSIAWFARANGLCNVSEDEWPAERIRIRITLAIYARNHQFPSEVHEKVKIPGQKPTPGWRGSHWKATYGKEAAS